MTKPLRETKRSKKARPNGSHPTLDEKEAVAELLLKRFVGREDAIAVGDSNTMRCQRLERPLTPKRVALQHIGGATALAVYPMLPGDVVLFSGLDFDNKTHSPDDEWKTKTRDVFDELVRLKIRPVVEISQSGKAAHIWVFFEKPVEAWLPREFWRLVLDYLGIAVPEIFPRQDTLRNKKVGNPIRLPLFNKSHFVDVRNWKRLKPLSVLQRINQITAHELKQAAAAIGRELLPPEDRFVPSTHGSMNRSTGIPMTVRQILAVEPEGFLARRWNGGFFAHFSGCLWGRVRVCRRRRGCGFCSC